MSAEGVQTALITGAGGGIGRALALELARDHRLLLVARNAEKLERLAAEIADLGYDHPVRALALDLSESGAPRRLYDTLVESGVAVDLLINNAGTGVYGAFAATSWEQEQAMIRLNVEALTGLTKLFLGPMLERGHGHLVNLASLAAYQPGGPRMAVYYASKSYVLSFTKGLAEELRGSGVRATAVCPGPVATGFGEASGAANTWLFRMRKTAPEKIARAVRGALRRPRAAVIPGFTAKLMALGGELPPRRIGLLINGLLLRESR